MDFYKAIPQNMTSGTGVTRLWERVWHLAAIHLTGVRLETVWNPPERTGDLHLATVDVKFRGSGRVGAIGFGADRSRKIASIKALMEGLESLALFESGISVQSRTGAAAHFSVDQAERAAYEELIERDAFLFHWLTETSGFAADESERKIAQAAFKDQHEVSAVGVALLQSADPRVSVAMVGARRAESGCVCVGTASSADRRSAIRKAAVETAVYSYMHRRYGGCPGDHYKSKSKTDEQARQRLPLAWHHVQTQQPRVAQLVDWILSGQGRSAGNHFKEEAFPLFEQTQFRRLPVRSSKYVVVRASHPRLLPLEFGSMFDGHRKGYLNFERVRMHSPAEYRFHSKGLFLPHPID